MNIKLQYLQSILLSQIKTPKLWPKLNMVYYTLATTNTTCVPNTTRDSLVPSLKYAQNKHNGKYNTNFLKLQSPISPHSPNIKLKYFSVYISKLFNNTKIVQRSSLFSMLIHPGVPVYCALFTKISAQSTYPKR